MWLLFLAGIPLGIAIGIPVGTWMFKKHLEKEIIKAGGSLTITLP